MKRLYHLKLFFILFHAGLFHCSLTHKKKLWAIIEPIKRRRTMDSKEIWSRLLRNHSKFQQKCSHNFSLFKTFICFYILLRSIPPRITVYPQFFHRFPPTICISISVTQFCARYETNNKDRIKIASCFQEREKWKEKKTFKISPVELSR